MLIAYFTETPQVSRRRRNVSTFPENRLNQNSGNVVGVYLLRKKEVELIERLLDNLFFGC